MSTEPAPAPAQADKTPAKPKKPHWKTIAAQAKKVEPLPALPAAAVSDVSHRIEPVKPGHKSFAKHTSTLVITIKGKVKKWALDHSVVDERELAYYISQSR